MDSKYVIKYYDCFLEDGKLNIVMQFAPNGTLHGRLHARRGQGLPEEKVWQFFIQAALGLRHVHGKRIVHRDVKSLNLFFDAEDNVLVGDLGIAKVLSPNTMFARTIVGTPYYLSPELCEDKPYNEKSDVWALGVVLYEMCTGGKHPFDAQNEGALIRKIMKGVWTPLPGGKFSSQLGDLLHSCLTMDHRTRPDTAGLLRNPALVSRARSLGIELDPDAKNLSVRSVVGIQGMTTAKQMHAGGAGRARAPLAEMAPPTAPPSWERQPEQHMLERVDSLNVSRRVHRPPRPPVGYAGVDDPDAYVYGDEPGVPRPVELPKQNLEATRVSLANASLNSSSHCSRQSPEAVHHDPCSVVYAEPAPQPPRMMNSLQREAWERKDAKDAAIAAGRGGLAAQKNNAFAPNATDPFVAHQLAKLGLDPVKYQQAMQAAAAERAEAALAARVHGRGNQLVGVMAGYGGAASFKARAPGDYYDEDYGAYYPAANAAAAGASKPVPLERPPVEHRRPPAGSPFELGDDPDQHDGYRTASMEQSAALRTATYEAPKFGRQRAQDLMITGPSMRGSGGAPSSRSAGGHARGGANMGYAQSTYGGSECTTVAPTSYYNA